MRPAKLCPLPLLLVVVACRDPVLDDKIANLGTETSGIPVNEYHRAGQACTACHVEGGPAGDKPFTVAGTVFAGTDRLVGVASVTIALRDSENTTPPMEVKTNCVGNFFIRPDGANGWQPKFPVTVAISKGVARRMNTVIGRASSCGDCHVSTVGVADPTYQVPHIYLFGGAEPGKPNGETDCAADPRAPGDPTPPAP
jgi:hypothetical protein